MEDNDFATANLVHRLEGQVDDLEETVQELTGTNRQLVQDLHTKDKVVRELTDQYMTTLAKYNTIKILVTSPEQVGNEMDVLNAIRRVVAGGEA